MTKIAKLPEQEWSHQIGVDDISSSGRAVQISPNDKNKPAIAKRLDILSLDALSAALHLTRESGHIIHVTGIIKATLTQACVVTLDPLQTSISEDFEAWFADEQNTVLFKKAHHEAKNKKDLLDLPMLEEHEDPEPVINGRIDLGELVVQHLSLVLPPYPVKPGAEIKTTHTIVAPKEHQLKPNPFAALKNWRPKD